MFWDSLIPSHLAIMISSLYLNKKISIFPKWGVRVYAEEKNAWKSFIPVLNYQEQIIAF